MHDLSQRLTVGQGNARSLCSPAQNCEALELGDASVVNLKRLNSR